MSANGPTFVIINIPQLLKNANKFYVVPPHSDSKICYLFINIRLQEHTYEQIYTHENDIKTMHISIR